MFLLLCFILFIWGIAGLCSDYDYDHEAEVRNARRDAERRHKETVNALRSKGTTRITRTIARDENGRIIAQEVTEDFIPDLDEISEEDYE